jgi:hypothetical protein
VRSGWQLVIIHQGPNWTQPSSITGDILTHDIELSNEDEDEEGIALERDAEYEEEEEEEDEDASEGETNVRLAPTGSSLQPAQPLNRTIISQSRSSPNTVEDDSATGMSYRMSAYPYDS